MAQAIPDQRIRERAYHIWEREGRPEGRALDHWQMARSELALEHPTDDMFAPDPIAETGLDYNPHPEPVEPIEAVENQGSFPGLTDQDEEQQTPERSRRPKSGRANRPAAPPT